MDLKQALQDSKTVEMYRQVVRDNPNCIMTTSNIKVMIAIIDRLAAEVVRLQQEVKEYTGAPR